MMNQHKYLIFAFFSLILFSACEKDECSHAQLKLSFSTNINQDQLVLNDVLYDDYMERKFRVELLKFYFSNCVLEKQDGSLIPIVDVALVDYSSATQPSIDLDVDTGNYINLHFAVGLDSLMNASDPSDFESSHPLSIANNTYWSWASKYKFFMLEGRVDSQSDGIADATFSYHSGFNSFYRELTIPLNDFNITSDGGSILLELNLDSVLYGEAGIVDFVTEPNAHSLNDYEILEIISNNLLNAFTIND
tara:strand:- start:1114 stop:1860 length:747 start_codon:yes stop_codon:yes gene_type:complete